MTVMHLDRLPSPQGRAPAAATVGEICAALAGRGVLPDDCFWTAIPAGDPIHGVKAGTPSLVFLYRGRTIFIEMARDERLQPVNAAQRQAHETIERAGAQAFMARTLGDVTDILRHDLRVSVRLRVR